MRIRIKLTAMSGEPVHVNPAHIAMVRPKFVDASETIVYLAGGHTQAVKESADQILELSFL
jgi:uncharacterized protein YlzI (FlbEa/FlbD family)